MEPYREDRPIIYIDKDKIKQNILETILSLPGARALKNFHDNPEGSALETLKLAAEDVVPFYGTYRNGGDWSDYAKEAAIFGIPMPYTRFPKGHPRAGEVIPNNLEESMKPATWAAVKSNWKYNRPQARKLYAEPPRTTPIYSGGNTEGGLSTRARINATREALTPVEVPAGPYQHTNTGSNALNTGTLAQDNNTVKNYSKRGKNINGNTGWQGDMYPPNRTLRNDAEYGPFQWEDKYTHKLDNSIDENELRWEYLINKTRTVDNKGKPVPSKAIVPKETIADIAMAQGRPDIAVRVMDDRNPKIGRYGTETEPWRVAQSNKFETYRSQQRPNLVPDDAQWKDINNRIVEKELRENFATLPEDPNLRYKFAEHYGVPDLYDNWINDPLLWAKYKNDVLSHRYHREAVNRTRRRAAGWENPNQ